MKFIREMRDGDHVSDIYLCKYKQSAVTKNGKPYENVILQDKTGTIDAKIWEVNSPGIVEFDVMDYVEITGEVGTFMNNLQLNVKRARICREGEYNPANYLPMTEKNIDEMYQELLGFINSIGNPYFMQLLESFFVNDQEFIKKFRFSSAAKSVHHGFVGGLVEHTLSVTKLCDFYSKQYPVLNRDLLLTAAICHDIGKIKELSAFPINDYTDDGQFLGHIVIGTQMIADKAKDIPNFPHQLLVQLQHCILAHHGKYEYGSPKLPALIEAVALNYADDTDAKMEIFKEILANNAGNYEWLGFNKLFDSNIKATRVDF